MEWWVWAIIIFFVIGMFGSDDKKKKQDSKDEAFRRMKEAEDYIMKSGDEEAIKALMLARANPNNYAQHMQDGMNKGNRTVKTALGVMAGVAAGNLISTAITASAISSALEEAQAGLTDTDSFADSGGDSDDSDFDIFS